MNKQEDARNYRRKWREKQRTNGLCLSCSRPAVPGMSYCNQHRRLKWKRSICPECGKVVVSPNNRRRFHTSCVKIKEKRRARKRVHNWHKTVRGKYLHGLSCKQYQQKHIELGLCKICTNKIQNGHRHCKTHLLKLRAKAHFGTTRVGQEILELIDLYKTLGKEIKGYG